MISCLGASATTGWGGTPAPTAWGGTGDDLLDGGAGQDRCEGGEEAAGDSAVACETVVDIP